MAECYRQEGKPEHFQKFFIGLGARFGRIRKRPKGKPSPQLHEYKVEKLQELEHRYTEGLINLYFADETHICTEGYVPYGWQFPGEDIYIPSQKGKRLNIFGMVDYKSKYKGFTAQEPITAQRICDFLDRLSFEIGKNLRCFG